MLDEGLLQHGELAVLRMAATQVGLVWQVPSGLSMITAQLKHCARPQPNLVPVNPRYSRRKSFIDNVSRTSNGP